MNFVKILKNKINEWKCKEVYKKMGYCQNLRKGTEPVLDRAAWNLFWSFEYLDFILIFWTKYAFYNGSQFNIEGVCLYKQVEPVMC